MATNGTPQIDPQQYAHAKAGWDFFTKAATVSSIIIAVVVALVVTLIAY